MGAKEKNLIDRTLLSLPAGCRMFRTNSGFGWTGTIVKKEKNMITISNPRPFRGLPEGFPDLFGWTEIEISPDMVGKKIAVATGYEVKATGNLRKSQQAFKKVLDAAGGIFKTIKD